MLELRAKCVYQEKNKDKRTRGRGKSKAQKHENQVLSTENRPICLEYLTLAGRVAGEPGARL
jgi:hypothetical protein